MELSYKIYHKNHIKCCYFTDTSKLKSVNHEEETPSLSHKMKVPARVYTTNDSGKNRMLTVSEVNNHKNKSLNPISK